MSPQPQSILGIITIQTNTSLLSSAASLDPFANNANNLYQLSFSHLGDVLSRRFVYGKPIIRIHAPD